jgi:hypothetical protein
MVSSSSPLLIQGDFRSSRSETILLRVETVLCVLMALAALVCISLYALVVQKQAEIYRIAKVAQHMNEQNASLRVLYNRERSYQNLEEDLKRVPHLSYPSPERKRLVKVLPGQQLDVKQWRQWLPAETGTLTPMLAGF